MTNPQNLEPRVDRLEIDMQALKRSVSDLRSTVSTLADLLQVQAQEADRRFEESRQQADQDRALMLQLIQAIAQGRNGGES
jgi:ElaB/YqjD/DUF883 family membrane-anchored ribosome-binding protein